MSGSTQRQTIEQSALCLLGSAFALRGLERGAIRLAKSEGASSLTIKAVKVTNPELAEFLGNRGYIAESVPDYFGRPTTNYSKTISFNGSK